MTGEATVREALRWGQQVLAQSALDTPRLDAEILLADILGVTRAQLHAHPQTQLSTADLVRHRHLIERRARREPVAYIVGRKEFYGLDLLVDHRVLVPRPETELLVEKAIAFCKRRTAGSGELVVADIGTGSGAIAVCLAVHLPQALVYATDASPGALEVAARNCRCYCVEDRVHLLQGHLLEPLPEPVDLIAANLPYVSEAELAQLPPEIRLYEPREALDGGPDGLDHIRSLLAQAKGHLKPGGDILLEIGATQGQAVLALASRHFPAARVEIGRDYAGLDRVVMVNT